MIESLFHTTDFSLLIRPLVIIAAAIGFGVIVERIGERVLHKKGQERGWTLAHGVVRAFRGMPTIWLGLIALHFEGPHFPLTLLGFRWLNDGITIVTYLSISIVIGRIATAFVRTHNARSRDAHQRITIVENLVRVIIYIFGILMIFHSLGVSVTPILTALGVGGLAVALALQDTLSNLFAGLYIIISKQLDPGDYVKLESGQEGTVVDIAWRVTSMRTTQNTLIIVPNSKFASSIFTNFDRPEKNSTIIVPFELKADANISEITTILTEIALEVQSEVDGAEKDVKPKVQFTELTKESITVNVVLGVKEYRVRGVMRDALYRKFFERLASKQSATPLASQKPA